MILSARPTQSRSVAHITSTRTYVLFRKILKNVEECVKIMITAGRDCGSAPAEWINTDCYASESNMAQLLISAVNGQNLMRSYQATNMYIAKCLQYTC